MIFFPSSAVEFEMNVKVIPLVHRFRHESRMWEKAKHFLSFSLSTLQGWLMIFTERGSNLLEFPHTHTDTSNIPHCEKKNSEKV